MLEQKKRKKKVNATVQTAPEALREQNFMPH
jgi:hypothetical protein